MSRDRGEQAEQLACDYLSDQGLELLEKNYWCKLGEIDLIMRDNSDLVFVEVRYRNHSSYGGGELSITPAKQRKLHKAVTHYLVRHNNYDKIPCRIDVVAIDNRGEINWIKNAIVGM